MTSVAGYARKKENQLYRAKTVTLVVGYERKAREQVLNLMGNWLTKENFMTEKHRDRTAQVSGEGLNCEESRNCQENGDRILLAVSFGTSFEDTREKTIGAIERRMAERFPDWKVMRCFTSRMIRKKLLERDGLHIDSPEEAICRARESGCREMVLQPLYLMHGLEHRRLMDLLAEPEYKTAGIRVGKPLLSDRSDFSVLAQAVRRHLPASERDTAVVLMGHGNGKKRAGTSPDTDASNRNVMDNAVFSLLQEALCENGDDRYYVATVEGEPALEDILPKIAEKHCKKVILSPFMVVAGDHARNDLAGDGEDSWKSIFLRKGFQVQTIVQGIGEWEEVQELFAEHAKMSM